ncbi:MAG: NAD(P)H-quinone oxidoreductase subunit 3 [Acidimicrobiales bacterium]|nr:NAD(P)H-quinone oxidoreductase subunit 3 [Acidimicrobiales bacterium]RZV47937.1 MAG: NADH-ubiquinone/plastoquinone oxidoreductase chain 3 [Acidimicrobiales bacterium]
MQYVPLVGLLVLTVLFAFISFIASKLLAPRRPNDKKSQAYECGIEPAKETPERFPVRFFLIAMIFIVFDIELIFFYPFAVSYGSVGVFGFVALLIFSFAVFESFVYLIGNGALEWGPVNQAKRLKAAVSAERTTTSTIRRVGTEGRPGEEAA